MSYHVVLELGGIRTAPVPDNTVKSQYRCNSNKEHYFICQPFRILRNLSAFQPCIPHSAFSKYYASQITNYESQILQNKSRFPPNGCQVSHSASGHLSR